MFLVARAQTSPRPLGETTPAATVTAASQAPDEATRKISELVRAGKYAEAQQLTTGLLVAYPEDQRLIKAKGMLDKILAGGEAVNAPANSRAPASNTTSDPSVANSNEEQFTGMEKVDYNALIELARQAQQNPDLDQQKSLLERFMDQSGPFLQKHPNQMLIWQLRAASALSLDDMYAQVRMQGGQKLLAAGAADSNDPNLEHLISQLKLKGWLDQEKMAEAKRNTADSLVNGLGMKFARVPRRRRLYFPSGTHVCKTFRHS